MDRFTTPRQRLYGILATLSILFATHVSEYAAKPNFVPGEELPQTPFSCVAEEPQDAAAAEDLALAFNAVCRLFGGVDTEPCLVFRHGNEPTWYEWMAMKPAWCRDKDYIRAVKDKIRDFPQTDNGYLWSWGTSPCWPTGDGALQYSGVPITVSVGADGLALTAQAPLTGMLRYRPPETGTHTVTVTAADGKTATAAHGTGPDGMIAVDLGERGAVSIVIA